MPNPFRLYLFFKQIFRQPSSQNFDFIIRTFVSWILSLVPFLNVFLSFHLRFRPLRPTMYDCTFKLKSEFLDSLTTKNKL